MQKIGFENIEVTLPTYENGVCTVTGKECNHLYNVGGYCNICGVLGNHITFDDGSNGGGNTVNTANNGKALTSADGMAIDLATTRPVSQRSSTT